jgi:uncharacterized protein (UPF0248 family)
MRDVIAAIVAVVLFGVALSLIGTLHVYRRRHRLAREAEAARGRRIIVELPTDPALTIFSVDERYFYYGDTAIPKDRIVAVRVLINGSPIAAAVARQQAASGSTQPTAFSDRPEGIARDRWDVAIETLDGTILVECGAIRERVSQELARKIFDAVKDVVDAS